MHEIFILSDSSINQLPRVILGYHVDKPKWFLEQFKR